MADKIISSSLGSKGAEVLYGSCHQFVIPLPNPGTSGQEAVAPQQSEPEAAPGGLLCLECQMPLQQHHWLTLFSQVWNLTWREFKYAAEVTG